MANAAKYAKAATGKLCQHFERKKDAEGQYVKFSNQDIDLFRTKQNYNLAPVREGGQVNFIHQRTAEVKCLKRDNVNVMCCWVVTLPKTFPASREREFFEETYRFLEKRYGEKNVISAYVHKDENQPHMHFAFVPVVKDKNGKEKVSAKEVLTKKELQIFHPALKKTLEQYFGFEVEILNGATKGGNKTIQELKAEKVAQEYENEIDCMVTDMLHTQEQIDKAHEELQELVERKESAQQELAGLNSRVMTQREIINLQGKKTITGALRGVTYEEYEALKRTAEKVNRVETDCQAKINSIEVAAERQIQIAKAEEQKSKSDVEKYRLRAEQAEQERPSVKLQMENVHLRGLLERMERRLRRIMEISPEPLRALFRSILNDREPIEGKRISPIER